MRRAFIITGLLLLLLLAVVSWLATLREHAAPQCAAHPESEAVAYPTDMWERAARIQGLRIVRGGEAPADAVWQDGMNEPEIGDPAAKKGGRVRRCIAGPYPANFLVFGSSQEQFFHYNLFTAVEIAPLRRHPVTGNSIPGTAARWAISGRTVWLCLHPQARYSNGRPLRAADYALGAILRAESGSAEHEQLVNAAEELRIINDELLALTLRHPQPQPEQAAAALLHAAEPGFYAEFGSDYRKRYAQRIPPTTGGYAIGKSERGRMIELVRVRDWWARELKYYRHTCNADSVEHHFPTDEAHAWELLMRGKLDMLQTRNIVAWQERALQAPGHLHRHVFHAEYPLPPYAIAFNTRTLDCPQLRRGLMHAMDMDRAVQLIFRGEGERLSTFSSGYGELTPQHTPTVHYSPAAAREAFALAGYTHTGADGILCRDDGKRLRIRLTYTPSEKISSLIGVLIQSAAHCGAEIIPEPAPWQTTQKKNDERSHELMFWATMPSSPYPDYLRFFGAAAAGADAPFGTDDEELNTAIAACEQARTRHELAAAMAAVDRRIAELCIWLPGWKENTVRLICHPHIRFPNCENCRFSTPTPYEVEDAHLYWVEAPAEP